MTPKKEFRLGVKLEGTAPFSGRSDESRIDDNIGVKQQAERRPAGIPLSDAWLNGR